MVVLTRIYTRAGDSGASTLASGETLPKSDLRFAAIGTVDEANAQIGMARLHLGGGPLDPILARIQNDLFDLGADLATTIRPGEENVLRIVDSQVERLEGEIDSLNARLRPLRSFVLPGGTAAAAALHLARTVARRAERDMVALAQTSGEAVGGPALRYVNRLSDLLFVAARVANHDGAADVLWQPGHNR